LKLATFRWGGRRQVGLLSADCTELTPLAAGPRAERRGVLALVEAMAEGNPLPRAASARLPISAVTLEAPLPLPRRNLFCVGRNYRAHATELAGSVFGADTATDEWPIVFTKVPESVIAPDEPICLPRGISEQIDYEAELAVVIGRGGRDIRASRAMDHVWGYTIVNDVTARDRQVRRNAEGFTWYELGRGKAFDTSAPMGPVIVSADEFGDPQSAMLRTRVNGELRQQASSGDMIWSCADLVHFFSTNFTLRPGMVILTGTPAGTAWSVDAELGGQWHPAPGLVAPTRYCEPGDVVESEIEGIGVLRNPIVAWGQEVGSSSE
jgi:2-keto-4-pentenoate hydratase/2-oxohepta-3-ene-1,7-dioic acid hydratase in catechol pathway